MTYKNDAGEDVYTFDVPQREGKEGFIAMHFGLMFKMGALMVEANRSATDTRIENMAQFMISMIPGKKNRAEIRDALKIEIDKRIAEAQKSGELTNDQIGTIRNQTCIEYVGNVMDFLDKHIGVTKENRIGIV